MPTLKRTGKTSESIKKQQWQCKFCHKEMVPRTGAIREWHFAHRAEASECPFSVESEPESAQHLALKRAAAEGLRKHFAEEVMTLEYEVRFPELGRIADALLTLKDSTRIAVEAQLSPLTLEHLQKRTHAYLRGEVEVIWVFLEQGSGLKEGGLWDTCRDWLMSEGHIVMTAKAIVTEKAIPLDRLPRP